MCMCIYLGVHLKLGKNCLHEIIEAFFNRKTSGHYWILHELRTGASIYVSIICREFPPFVH